MTGTDTQATPLATFSSITAVLHTADKTIDITCELTVDHHGKVAITCAPIELNEGNIWLINLISQGGRSSTWSTLRGTDPNGATISTDYFIIEGDLPTPNPNGPTTVRIRGTAARCTIAHQSLPATSEGCAVMYRTIGMRGYLAQHLTTNLGPLILAGVKEIEDYDRVAGFLKLTATANQSLNEWLAATDELVRHTLKIVSLADGKLLHWSIRQLYDQSDRLVQTQLNGAHHTDAPWGGIWHFIHLQPALDMSTKFTDALRNETGIELAIELFLMHPTYLEVRLFTAMTALEHLVSRYAERHTIQPPLDRETFRRVVSPALEAAYDRATSTSIDAGIPRVRERIANLNHVTFKDKLWRMLTSYSVPLNGIDDRINEAIHIRHKIVHASTHLGEFTDLVLHVTVLRELLARTFLTLLKYEGTYQSWLNGPEWTTFPPTNVTVQP